MIPKTKTITKKEFDQILLMGLVYCFMQKKSITILNDELSNNINDYIIIV